MHVYLPATTTVFYVLQALFIVSAQKVPASVLSAAIDLLDASRNVSSLHMFCTITHSISQTYSIC
jgi:hypothetical protein